jgi:hypothetical protein
MRDFGCGPTTTTMARLADDAAVEARQEIAADCKRFAERGATLVVFHTAALAYVREAGERAAFASSARELGAVWIANEAPEKVPGVAQEIPRERPPGDDVLLCVDGVPTAWTDGHGTSIHWRRPARGDRRDPRTNGRGNSAGS